MPYININLPVAGTDTSAPAEFISQGETPQSKNMLVRRSVLQKRYGTSLFQTAAIGGSNKEIMLLKEFMRDNTLHCVRVGQTKAETITKSTKTWTDVTGVDLTGGSADVFSCAFPLLDYQRTMVISNYVDPIRKYLGTGNFVALGGTPPKAKFMVEMGPFLVLAYVNDGVTNYRLRVQWSDTGKIEVWNAGYAGFQDLQEDLSDITGLCLYGNFLCVHKEYSIYLGSPVASSEVFQFNRVNTGVGTVCNNTIQMLPTGEQIFLALDGLHLFTGSAAPAIPCPMNDEIRETLTPESVNKCWSLVVKELDEYWCGMPTGGATSPGTVYKFNYRTRVMYKDERLGISTAGLVQLDTSRSIDSITTPIDSMTGRFDDVALLKLNKSATYGDINGNVTISDSSVNNDNGVAISSFWDTPDMFRTDDAGTPLLCRWLSVALAAIGNTVDVQYSIDRGATWSPTQTLTLDSDYPDGTNPIVAYFDVVAETLRLRFSNDKAGETFSLKKLRIEYAAREGIR